MKCFQFFTSICPLSQIPHLTHFMLSGTHMVLQIDMPLIYGHTHPYNVHYKHAHRHMCAHMHTSEHRLSVLASTVCAGMIMKQAMPPTRLLIPVTPCFFESKKNGVIQAGVGNEVLVC